MRLNSCWQPLPADWERTAPDTGSRHHSLHRFRKWRDKAVGPADENNAGLDSRKTAMPGLILRNICLPDPHTPSYRITRSTLRTTWASAAVSF